MVLWWYVTLYISSISDSGNGNLANECQISSTDSNVIIKRYVSLCQCSSLFRLSNAKKMWDKIIIVSILWSHYVRCSNPVILFVLACVLLTFCPCLNLRSWIIIFFLSLRKIHIWFHTVMWNFHMWIIDFTCDLISHIRISHKIWFHMW